MKTTNSVSILVLISLNFILFILTGCSTKTGLRPAENNGGIVLPDGFAALIVADSLGDGRHIVVNSNGDIYVTLRNLKDGGGVVGLRDTSGDGKADIIKFFGPFSGTGIDIHNGYLYVGADTIVIRYKLIDGELVPNLNYEVIAKGFVPQNQHETKPITFDTIGNMYVTIGAPSNACQEPDRTPGTLGVDPCPLLAQYGGIWRFKADSLNQDQMAQGYRYATGIRNAVALDWNKSANSLYALQHGRDQLSQFWPELYSENEGINLPAEEFFQVKEGSDFGWPYCYFDPFQNKKVLSPEYGGNKTDQGRCADKDQPIMSFPAHIAPNDLIFYSGNNFPEKYQHGAFIAFHGSWNRAPQQQKGYLVAFVPFKGELPSGKWEIFADNFAGSDSIMSPRDSKHRPCGLAQGQDGSLYIVDSVKGKVWRIFYKQ